MLGRGSGQCSCKPKLSLRPKGKSRAALKAGAIQPWVCVASPKPAGEAGRYWKGQRRDRASLLWAPAPSCPHPTGAGEKACSPHDWGEHPGHPSPNPMLTKLHDLQYRVFLSAPPDLFFQACLTEMFKDPRCLERNHLL